MVLQSSVSRPGTTPSAINSGSPGLTHSCSSTGKVSGLPVSRLQGVHNRSACPRIDRLRHDAPGTVVAVDLNTLQVSPPLLTGGEFGTMDYNAITLEVYVPDLEAKQIDILSPITVGTVLPPQEPERVIRLNASPQAVAMGGDGNRLRGTRRRRDCHARPSRSSHDQDHLRWGYAALHHHRALSPSGQHCSPASKRHR